MTVRHRSPHSRKPFAKRSSIPNQGGWEGGTEVEKMKETKRTYQCCELSDVSGARPSCAAGKLCMSGICTRRAVETPPRLFQSTPQLHASWGQICRSNGILPRARPFQPCPQAAPRAPFAPPASELEAPPRRMHARANIARRVRVFRRVPSSPPGRIARKCAQFLRPFYGCVQNDSHQTPDVPSSLHSSR